MVLRKRRKVDLAIVGAGAAGLYAAKRLGDALPGCSIRVYEAGERLGGRLWSAMGANGPIAELGAMSISDRHENVMGLTAALGLSLSHIDFSDRCHFVRGAALSQADYAARERVPYRLAPAEMGKTPRTLLIDALHEIVPGVFELWPFAKAGPQATFDYLRRVRIAGLPLWRWGYWNLLATVRSNEAIELLRATFGSAAAFRNANALEAIFTLIWEMHPGQQHYRLTNGMSALAEALAEACGPRVEIALNHRLTSAAHTGSCFELLFATPDGMTSEQANGLIVAIPKHALDLVTFDADLAGQSFREDSDGVSPVPACKLYLLFEKAWWPHTAHCGDAGPQQIGACFTDLPMRQCYYFTPREGERALLMACFADDAACGFWSVMGATDDGLDQRGPASARARMVESACEQLRTLHPGTRIDAPLDARFVDWSADPFGGAWHSWRADVQSWEVRARMRQPNPNLPFFTCGEAFAQPQGWIEGALNNAEMMLERHFGVPRPQWVREDYPFEL